MTGLSDFPVLRPGNPRYGRTLGMVDIPIAYGIKYELCRRAVVSDGNKRLSLRVLMESVSKF